MKLSSTRHGGDVFKYTKEEREKFLDFSININPLGLSPLGKKQIDLFWVRETLRYPDVEYRDLIQAIAKRYKVQEDSILVGNGATELMYAMIRALHPSKVIVPAPSFSEYRISATANQIPVISFPINLETGELPLGRINELCEENSLLYLGNPNNPDGSVLAPEVVKNILEIAADKKTILVLDESFIDFVCDDASYRNWVQRYDNLIVLTSLTKFYAIPGLRLGSGFFPKKLKTVISNQLIPWNVNGIAQLYMQDALMDFEYQEKSREFCEMERKRLVNQLREIPDLRIYNGVVNFILCRLVSGPIRTVEALEELLARENILIRNCANYESLDDTYFRICVHKPEYNDVLIKALKKIFRKGAK